MTDGRPKNRVRSIVFPIVLMTVSVGISLVFAEMFVRLLVPRPPSWLDLYERHPVMSTYRLASGQRRHVDTGETNWTVQTDDNGFRVALEPEARGVNASCRALWLGDSYTFGHGVDYDESFVGRIEALNPDMRHLNSGVPGYGPIQYRETLEFQLAQGLDFEHLVVATYVGNDFHDSIWSKDVPVYAGVIGNQNNLKSKLATHLHLYRLAAAAWHRIGPAPKNSFSVTLAQLADPAGWDEEFLSDATTVYEKEWARILEIGRGLDVPVSALILPTRPAVAALRDAGTSGAAAAGDADPLLPVGKARAILERLGIPYVDATPALATYPTDQMFYTYDGHLTIEGSELVARAAFEGLDFRCPTAEAGAAMTADARVNRR